MCASVEMVPGPAAGEPEGCAHEGKAERLAAAAGVELGELLDIDYSWSEVRFDSSIELTVHAAMAPPDYDVSPEDVAVEALVNVVWWIA